MAIYLIDGDNNPGFGACGAQWLTDEDRIIVFHNNSNTFYKQDKNRQKLEESTKAKVQFELISNAKNSVDFDIAVKAGFCVAEDAEQQIFLVSSDNHFELIAGLICSETGSNGKVRRVDQVWRGILTDEANLTDLNMIKGML